MRFVRRSKGGCEPLAFGDKGEVLKFEPPSLKLRRAREWGGDQRSEDGGSASANTTTADKQRSEHPKSQGLKLTGVISPPQGLCTAANWVFISDPPSPIGLRRAGREFSTKGLQVHETDWSQVREIELPTDARGSLIGLVRFRLRGYDYGGQDGHRPPEKAVEIDVGSRLR